MHPCVRGGGGVVSEDSMPELCLLVLYGPQGQAWWQDFCLLNCLTGPRQYFKALWKERCKSHSWMTGGEGAAVLEAGLFPTAPQACLARRDGALA